MKAAGLLLLLVVLVAAKKAAKSVVIPVTDHKEFKKILRTKTNVLVLFTVDTKAAAEAAAVVAEVSAEVKGLATCLAIDCQTKEGKKLCKKLKVASTTFALKHYKDGEFHKDYDRSISARSLGTFLRDPSGELPWEEDPAASAVTHWTSPRHFDAFLGKEKGKVGWCTVHRAPCTMHQAMHHAPWCTK